MTRIRFLTVALLALAMFTPASARAATQTIPGSGPNMTIYVGDTGSLQGVLPGMTQGMFYGADDGPASSYFYFRVKNGQYADRTFSSYEDGISPVSNGPVTGNFTPQSPAQVETVFDITPDDGPPIARVRQTILYVGYQQRFTVNYQVTNVSGAPLQYVVGTAADLYIGGDDSGTGIFVDGPQRFVGGTNTVSAKVGGLQEVTSSRLPGESADVPVPRWASYGEDAYGTITSRLQSADAFDNTVNPTLLDNGVGVAWNDRATTALATSATARYEVLWVAEQAVPLRATPANASVELPGNHDVVLTLSEPDGDPIPGAPVRYRVNGVGATPADPSSNIRAVTNAAGQIVVRLSASEPGTSTVVAFADVVADDGVRDPAEPATSAEVRWLADNHVSGPPQAPPSLQGPNGSVPVGVVANPENAEAPTYTFGRSASAAAGFADCTFDGAQGRALDIPITVDLQPGAATIDSAQLLLVDPARHDPNSTSGATQPPVLPVTGSDGSRRTFQVGCVVNREMWVRFTLTENGQSQTFVIPVGGLLLIDPQGVVYDRAAYDRAVSAGRSAEQARATAAIRGATVRLQRRNSEGTFVTVISGDPGISPRVNPQVTVADGLFQWDVSAGTYRVLVTAPGFADHTSREVQIPPPVLDLHIPMERPGSTDDSGGGTGGGGTGTGGGGSGAVAGSSQTGGRAPAVVVPRAAAFVTKLTRRGKAVKVGRKRQVTLGTATCAAGTTCPTATVTLRPQSRGSGKRRLPAVVGRARVAIVAGKPVPLQVTLTKAVVKRFKARRRTPVKVTVAGAGQPTRSTRLVIRG